MSNTENLNKATFFNGETITGSFTITVPTESPPVPPINVLNAGLQFLLKLPNTADNEALANLTVGNGITITSNTSSLIEGTYEIPGTATREVLPTGRDTSVSLDYELLITYDGDTNFDVLEIGSLKIKPRVKTEFN